MRNWQQPLALCAADAFDFLRDPLLIPEWSSLMEDVGSRGANAYAGLSLMGEIPFTWDPDPIHLGVHATYTFMGVRFLVEYTLEPCGEQSTLHTRITPADGLEMGSLYRIVLHQFQGHLHHDTENFAQWAGLC